MVVEVLGPCLPLLLSSDLGGSWWLSWASWGKSAFGLDVVVLSELSTLSVLLHSDSSSEVVLLIGESFSEVVILVSRLLVIVVWGKSSSLRSLLNTDGGLEVVLLISESLSEVGLVCDLASVYVHGVTMVVLSVVLGSSTVGLVVMLKEVLMELSDLGGLSLVVIVSELGVGVGSESSSVESLSDSDLLTVELVGSLSDSPVKVMRLDSTNESHSGDRFEHYL